MIQSDEAKYCIDKAYDLQALRQSLQGKGIESQFCYRAKPYLRSFATLTSILLQLLYSIEGQASYLPTSRSPHEDGLHQYAAYRGISAGARNATSVTIMLVPVDSDFIVSIDEWKLRYVSCVYFLDARHVRSFKALTRILDQSISNSGNLGHPSDFRAGLIFWDKTRILSEYYFQDWGGAHQVRGISKIGGISDGRLLIGKADLIDQLRELSKTPDFILEKLSSRGCK